MVKIRENSGTTRIQSKFSGCYKKKMFLNNLKSMLDLSQPKLSTEEKQKNWNHFVAKK